ncbi:MAG: DUF1624 domain-containing protein [Oscillospiraceae bacterium]|nr:DUF1624 domain-containing protein [Oscillospiraceae bacterium]
MSAPQGSRPARPERLCAIDTLRGIAAVLMVVHHIFFDLVTFSGAPGSLFYNWVFDLIHYVSAGLFIILAGVSSRFSRNNYKRALRTFGCALIVSAGSLVAGEPIIYGVLHFLATAMLLYALCAPLAVKLERFCLLPVLCVIGTVIFAPLASGAQTAYRCLWMFGWVYPGFYSADYFPLLPWVFVFLFGTWLGALIREERFPAPFYAVRENFAARIGRHAMLLYLLHQPVIYALALLVRPLFA